MKKSSSGVLNALKLMNNAQTGRCILVLQIYSNIPKSPQNIDDCFEGQSHDQKLTINPIFFFS